MVVGLVDVPAGVVFAVVAVKAETVVVRVIVMMSSRRGYGTGI